MFNTTNSILQQLKDPKGFFKGVSIFVKRDDLIDDLVSGNKWRKLKYNILEASRRKNEQLLTFGGAFSNHLIATAKACNMANLPSIGLVRGEELNQNSNKTLQQCTEFGMMLKFISRNEYTLRHDKMYIDHLHDEYPNSYIVPEGGANYFGMIGCQEIWTEIPKKDFKAMYVSAGTGTTAAGLLAGMPTGIIAHVVSALKGDFMQKNIHDQLKYAFFDEELIHEKLQTVQFLDDTKFGGYAKITDELITFIDWVNEEFGLPLDKVYTAKTFFHLYQNIQQGKFSKGDAILFVHTGGLQGN